VTSEVAVAPRAPLEFNAVNFDGLYRMSQALARSGLLPETLRGKPDDVAVVLMTGRELGLEPMQALRGIHVVKGRPTMAADLLAGLVLKSGLCEYLTLVESTPTRASYRTKRVGSEQFVQMSYSMEDANRAGLSTNDNYRKSPNAMLRARCVAAIVRAVYPDVAYGLYLKDEIVEEEVERAPSAVSNVVVLQPEEAPQAEPQAKPATIADLKARAKAAKKGTAAERLAVAQAAAPAAPAPAPAAAPAADTSEPPEIAAALGSPAPDAQPAGNAPLDQLRALCKAQKIDEIGLVQTLVVDNNLGLHVQRLDQLPAAVVEAAVRDLQS
jgi:hypothetical protein